MVEQTGKDRKFTAPRIDSLLYHVCIVANLPSSHPATNSFANDLFINSPFQLTNLGSNYKWLRGVDYRSGQLGCQLLCPPCPPLISMHPTGGREVETKIY